MNNSANLFEPIHAVHVGPAPLFLRTVQKLNSDYIAGGVPQAHVNIETYVLLSALPRDIQDRVKTAIQAIVAGM